MGDKPPLPVVCLTPDRKIVPASAYFAELIEQHPSGTEFDLKARTKRSVPHNAMYWAMLRNVVKATGRWLNEESLNRDIKDALGAYNWRTNEITDERYKEYVSKDFDKMKQHEFNEFFDAAVALLAEELGIDPLSLESK